jgi:hypothetical protein
VLDVRLPGLSGPDLQQELADLDTQIKYKPILFRNERSQGGQQDGFPTACSVADQDVSALFHRIANAAEHPWRNNAGGGPIPLR